VKTRLLLSVAALAVLTGCAKNPQAVIPSNHERFLRDKSQYEPMVEKDYWAAMPVLLCTKPAPNPEGGDCIALAVTTKLRPDAIEEGMFGQPYYHVKLADGRAGYVDASTFKSQTTETDLEKAEANCIRRGDPRVGMTRNQVEATCWGKPDHVDRRETARGITERYVYGKSRFVLLHNGIVTSVQISGTLR
jgi:hypothetical protein